MTQCVKKLVTDVVANARQSTSKRCPKDVTRCIKQMVSDVINMDREERKIEAEVTIVLSKLVLKVEQRCGGKKRAGLGDPLGANPKRRHGMKGLKAQQPGSLIGHRAEVFWDGDEVWYSGNITEYDTTSDKYRVLYDDGWQDWETFGPTVVT